MSAKSPYTPQGKPTAVPGVHCDGLQFGMLGCADYMQYRIREDGNPADGEEFYIEHPDPDPEVIRAAKEAAEREFLKKKNQSL